MNQVGPGQQYLKLLLGDYAMSFISLRASGGQQGGELGSLRRVLKSIWQAVWTH